VETPRGRFRVVPTPGHADDHVAFFDEDASALFTGDAYLGRFRAARTVEDVHTELDSMRRLADLDAAILYPGHGATVRRPRAKLLETVEHFESLARRAHALAAKGWGVRRIRREILGGEPLLTYISAGEFSANKLVENLLRRAPA
jgi:glyoxylase-like metal-dependent hydrolase (beta-lactamase superfamily II)